MTEYLTPGQRAELERQLGGGLTGEQVQAAMNEGARMAQADEVLRRFGFASVEELAEAYERTKEAVEELRGMLEQLTDLEQAERTAAQLDARHPEYAVRRQIELELRPMREQARQDARSRMIRHDWQESAAQMQDLEALLPEIAAYIMRNPRYAGESDGLRRAYDAVRSGLYRDEQTMLADPEFIGRMAENGQIREAVLRAHMEELRGGGALPQPVGTDGGAGKTPVTGRKPIAGMEQAKKRLEAMLKA